MLKLYTKWNIRQTYVFGNADKPVFMENLLLNHEEETLCRIGMSMKDISMQLFLALFGKEGSLSLEKMGRILDVSVEGALHNAFNDAKLLFLCYRAVVRGIIPQERISMARDELMVREAYQKNRRMEEARSGIPVETKELTKKLIEEILLSLPSETLREQGKLLALCDDLLLAAGEKVRYQKEYFQWI